MVPFALICAGGALGTGARYLLQTAAVRAGLTALPFGTLFINILGSFAIALVLRRGAFSPELRDALTIGVLGGFTTYSSFNEETLGFIDRGAYGHAALYVLLTVLGALLAGVAARQL